MKFYQEITLILDGEITTYFLWSKLFTQIHIALAQMEKSGVKSIGVSFPNYRYEIKNGKTFATLGDKVRIFAPTQEVLEIFSIDLKARLQRYTLTDYVHIKAIKAVPDEHGWVVVKRYRKKDMETVATEFAKFKNISFEEALIHCQTHKAKAENYPYISLKSETNQSFYRLNIRQIPTDNPQIGEFNSYGMNGMMGNITIPHW
ncbi:type I-F CRISPR-associated endoribonuclease Cas6/Csy4 [Moraxella boevrei]|uniref:type I-F CRISPR-associated endoribonuclease Cas6/Csy4 n=1 Tax=Faucicola boevrei TaxID=346665 RepID=UPI003735A4E1